jgi:hypothetical protein
LAPDIQEELLFLERGAGRERVTERTLRGIVADTNWGRQRRMWAGLRRR